MEPLEFVRKYEAWYQLAYGDLGWVERPFSGCDPDAFISATCCPTHRMLEEQHLSLRSEGLAFGIPEEVGEVTSISWWAAFSVKFNIHLPPRRPYIWPEKKTWSWEITELYQNPFSKDAPDDPQAPYMITMLGTGNRWQQTFSLPFSQIKVLMTHFKVNSPEYLKGKSFISSRNAAGSALDLLIVQTLNGGYYKPPSGSQVRRRLVEALAEFRQPDFSKVDDETVAKAIHEYWDGPQPKEDFFNWLKFEVRELSNNTVFLEEADINLFSIRLRGPAVYLALRRGIEQQLVILGPYSHPVQFVNEQEPAETVSAE